MTSRTTVLSLLGVILIAIGSPAAALAQGPTEGPDAADVAPALGFDAQSGPLVFEGPPALTGEVVPRHGDLLTLDVHWRDAGRLGETVAANNLRLEAGALLFRTSFRAGGLRSDVLPAWCGSEPRRRLSAKRAPARLVLMPPPGLWLEPSTRETPA